MLDKTILAVSQLTMTICLLFNSEFTVQGWDRDVQSEKFGDCPWMFRDGWELYAFCGGILYCFRVVVSEE